MTCSCGYHDFCINGSNCPDGSAQRRRAELAERMRGRDECAEPLKISGTKQTEQLKCPGVGRDKDCISALQFYFSRKVTDDEMRFLHDVMQRTVACVLQKPKSK